MHPHQKPSLDWAIRFQVCNQGYCVISSLSPCAPKCKQVLLDAEMNRRPEVFGLARLHRHRVEAPMTRLIGTTGYITPKLAKRQAPSSWISPATGLFLKKLHVDYMLKIWQQILFVAFIHPRLVKSLWQRRQSQWSSLGFFACNRRLIGGQAYGSPANIYVVTYHSPKCGTDIRVPTRAMRI